MLLSNETKDKLVNLAPDVLFHGTRFLVPIFIHDEIALSLTTEAVHLTSCPEEAATYAAAGPRPFDDGRGAIIALDRSLLPDTYKGEGKNDFNLLMIYFLAALTVFTSFTDTKLALLPKLFLT